ncbi:MAG: RNA-binding protein [Proteobacteria bacterium]|nr:RNA-binding protein [Pseudomonadota bacterium]
MNIFVGNLATGVTEDDLRQAFEGFGKVASARIIKDKFSGQTRGFGFVEMPELAEAKAALESMNGKDLKGRNLTVNEARPQADRPRSGGGGGGGGRRSFGGGGDRGGGGGGGRGGDRGGGRRSW